MGSCLFSWENEGGTPGWRRRKNSHQKKKRWKKIGHFRSTARSYEGRPGQAEGQRCTEILKVLVLILSVSVACHCTVRCPLCKFLLELIFSSNFNPCIVIFHIIDVNLFDNWFILVILVLLMLRCLDWSQDQLLLCGFCRGILWNQQPVISASATIRVELFAARNAGTRDSASPALPHG